jgi:hypothetical protein
MRAQRRRAFQQGYRRLLAATVAAEEHHGADNEDASLVMYVRQRVRDEVEATRRAALTRGTGKTMLPAAAFRQRIQTMVGFADALQLAGDVPEIAAATRALSHGFGDASYRRTVERSVLSAVAFTADGNARNSANSESASQRQTMVMLHAVVPFAEKLAIMHRDGVDDAAMSTALASRRSTTRSFFTNLSSSSRTESVHVDVDDELGKQTVYIRSVEFSPGTNDQHVEARELPTVRRSSAHAEWANIAERLLEVLRAETPLHASRATTLCGHGVGGAVAVLLGLLLAAEGFVIRNVITFGAPMCVTGLEERSAIAINAIRVQHVIDRRVGAPASDDNFEPFFHIGELLEVDDTSAAEGTADAQEAAGRGIGRHRTAAGTCLTRAGR